MSWADSADSPSQLTADVGGYMAGSHQLVRGQGQIRNCSSTTLLLPLPSVQTLPPLTRSLRTREDVEMSLQPPSLAMRSKSPSGGSTKAVILVHAAPAPAMHVPAVSYAHTARSEALLAEPGSGRCPWSCPRYAPPPATGPHPADAANSRSSPSPATPSSSIASAQSQPSPTSRRSSSSATTRSPSSSPLSTTCRPTGPT